MLLTPRYYTRTKIAALMTTDAAPGGSIIL